MKRHLVPQTGLRLERFPDRLEGCAEIAPEVCVPGTGRLRTSVLVLWADVVAGLLTGFAVAPRVPVTLELSVETFAPAVVGSRVGLCARVVKAGSSVTHVEIEVHVDGEPAGLCHVSFMLAPDVSLKLPETAGSLRAFEGEGRISKPYAEQVDCRRLRPGVATLPRTEQTMNASRTVNGGVAALAVEEAVLSTQPVGTVVEAMALRYVRPARVGPVEASAEPFGDRWRVQVVDAGSEDRRQCVLATVRTARA